MKRGLKVDTFTVEKALELYVRATNDDQRVEILDKLTKPKLLELRKLEPLILQMTPRSGVLLTG